MTNYRHLASRNAHAYLLYDNELMHRLNQARVLLQVVGLRCFGEQLIN